MVNIKELAAQVSAKLDITKKDAEAVIRTTFEELPQMLKADTDGEVNIPGFGKFKKEEKPARMGRDPRNGTPVEIAAHSSIKFKAASAFKNLIK